MDTTSPAPPSSIREFIIGLVNQAWNSHREGVFLARLGAELKPWPELVRAELGKKGLSAYINDDLKGDVFVLTAQDNELVKVALPERARREVEQEPDKRRYFPKGDPIRRAAQASGLSNAIVTAFTRALPPGKKRVVTFSPVVRFDDLDADAPIPETAKEIDPKWIAAAETQPDSATILSNIAAWRATADVQPKTIAKPKSDEGLPRSLLDAMLGVLTDADQRRIQLPLDVVAKLHRQPYK